MNNPQAFIESIIEQAEEAGALISSAKWHEASSYLQDVIDDAERLQKWVDSHL